MKYVSTLLREEKSGRGHDFPREKKLAETKRGYEDTSRCFVCSVRLPPPVSEALCASFRKAHLGKIVELLLSQER